MIRVGSRNDSFAVARVGHPYEVRRDGSFHVTSDRQPFVYDFGRGAGSRLASTMPGLGREFGRETAAEISGVFPAASHHFGQGAAGLVAGSMPSFGKELGKEAAATMVSSLPAVGQHLGKDAAEKMASAMPTLGSQLAKDAASDIAGTLPFIGQSFGKAAAKTFGPCLVEAARHAGIDSAQTVAKKLPDAGRNFGAEAAHALPKAGREFGAEAISNLMTNVSMCLGILLLVLAMTVTESPFHVGVLAVGGFCLICNGFGSRWNQLLALFRPESSPQVSAHEPLLKGMQQLYQQTEEIRERMDEQSRLDRERLEEERQTRFKSFERESQKYELLEQIYCILTPSLFSSNEEYVVLESRPQQAYSQRSMAVVSMQGLIASLQRLNKRWCWSVDIQTAVSLVLKDCFVQETLDNDGWVQVRVRGVGASLEQKLQKQILQTMSKLAEVPPSDQAILRKQAELRGFWQAVQPSGSDVNITFP